MKVIRNYLYNTGYQVLALIVPLVTSYYVSRVLRPEGVGINAFTNSIVQYFILLANIGIGYYGNREIAYVRDSKEKLSQTFWEIQIIKTLTTLFSYSIFVIFMMVYTHNRIYMWAQSINLISVAFDISWLYMGIEDFKRTVIRNILVKIISTIAIFTFVRNENDLALYIVLLACSSLFGNLTLWPYLKYILSNKKNIFMKLKPWRHFIPCVMMFIPTIATQLYVQLNRTMLGVMVNETASGYYQYSDSLVKLILAFVTATGTVMMPHVSNAFANGDITRVNKMLYKSFDFVSAIAFPMSFGLAGISTTLSILYYGKGYAPVGIALFIESIVIVLIGWSNVIGVQYLLPINKTKEFTASVTCGAIINIVLNIPLIKLWGLEGAMFSTVISEMGVTIYQLYIARNLLDLYSLFKGSWKYLFSGIIMFIPVYLMNIKLSISWLFLILEVLVGIVIYAVMLLILKAEIIYSAKSILEKYKNKN